jgi:hypothetical protein
MFIILLLLKKVVLSYTHTHPTNTHTHTHTHTDTLIFNSFQIWGNIIKISLFSFEITVPKFLHVVIDPFFFFNSILKQIYQDFWSLLPLLYLAVSLEFNCPLERHIKMLSMCAFCSWSSEPLYNEYFCVCNHSKDNWIQSFYFSI